MRLHLCAHVLITTAAESSYNMLCDISVTMQALVQITAAGKKCSEAAVWEACMNSLRSAAAALECAVTSLVKAAAGREVPPNVAHACCMAVDGLLGAADPLLGIVKGSQLAILRGANQPSMPCCVAMSGVALDPRCSLRWYCRCT